MNKGRTIFAQLMSLFTEYVETEDGDQMIVAVGSVDGEHVAFADVDCDGEIDIVADIREIHTPAKASTLMICVRLQ